MTRASRRQLVLGGLAACLVPRLAWGEEAPFEIVDLPLDADRRFGRSCRLALPRGGGDSPLPVLVLLHGLGETKSERLGVDAWLTPYGAARAWQRLCRPPFVREKENHLSEAELAAFNRSLAAEPFAGTVLVCPFMPNPHRFAGGASSMLDRYTQFLVEQLLPAVRARVPRASAERAATGIAGVSLGGYAALEVVLRAPRAFATVGTVQGAYRAAKAIEYARRIAELREPALSGVYVATSTADPYRAANERLAERLAASGVATRLSVRRGPHSQGFLREIGTPELLLWQDRALRGRIETGEVRAS